MAKLPSFKVSADDHDVIQKIIDRALSIWPRADRSSLTMDVTACHANGNPLRLEALLEADDFNFMHDVVGISKHIDRNTGKLTGFFSPRFSRPTRSRSTA